jgi:hypothetical protein
MTPLCLMWCIWRERNARCYLEISVEELKLVMFKPLHTWIVGYDSPFFIFKIFLNVLTFVLFFFFFFFFFLNRVLLYTSCVLGLHFSALLMRLIYLLKKNCQ